MFAGQQAWEVGRLNASVDLSLVILPDKKKPSMRGQIVFPRNPSSKPSSLLVFCGENEVQQALAAGADLAGGPELFEQVSLAGGRWGSLGDGGCIAETGILGPLVSP